MNIKYVCTYINVYIQKTLLVALLSTFSSMNISGWRMICSINNCAKLYSIAPYVYIHFYNYGPPLTVLLTVLTIDDKLFVNADTCSVITFIAFNIIFSLPISQFLCEFNFCMTTTRLEIHSIVILPDLFGLVIFKNYFAKSLTKNQVMKASYIFR